MESGLSRRMKRTKTKTYPNMDPLCPCPLRALLHKCRSQMSRRRSASIPNANDSNRNKHRNTAPRSAAILAYPSCFLLLLVYFLHLPHLIHANRPPQFVLSEGQSEIVLRLKEGKETPVGSLVYTLRGYDFEDDPLTFALRGQIANEVFQIENLGTNEAHLHLKKELDREVEDEYMFIVTLTDGNLPEGNFVTQSLLLLVDDINDSVPTFLEYNTTLKVPENSQVPMVLTRLEAVDRDEGPYGQVVYKLLTEPGDESLFSISTSNGQGVVKLLKPLDYEKKFLHQIKVLAVDRAISGQVNTATAALVVNVLDEEDTPPYFLNVQPVSRIREDVPIGSYLLQVVAVDGDRMVNNQIKYSLLNENELFGIDSQTGIIYTKAALDRDHVLGGSYILQVVATEQSKGSDKPSVSTEITIIVTDVNDERPTFKSSHYQAEIVENSPVDVPLTFLGDSIPECYDYDLGLNGTFRLYTQGDGNLFNITPSEGINHVSFLVRVKNSARLDYEKMKDVNFTLVCEEISGEKGSSAAIQVFVRDANDNHPEFTKSVYMASVFENSLPGTSIVQVQAHDIDSGEFGTEGIRYTSLSGPIANMLHLDPYSGIITVTNNSLLDREMNSVFHLTVEARDLNGRGNRNTAVIQISLMDVNDESPVFLSSRYEGRVFENEIEFVTPLQVKAVDGDMPNTPNSQVRYSIVAGNEGKHFDIDKETGVISIIKPFDFEKLPVIKRDSNVKQLNFTVRANDLGKPPRFSLAQVKVFVSDTNDFSPSWKEAVYNKIIREDVVSGTEIVQVVGYDKDGSPPFNRVLYRIEKGDQDKFVIDADTGIVRVALGATLDYNAKTHHLLEVYMVDGGGLKSSPAFVNISLIDVNNKSPKFILNNDGGIYHAKVMENAAIGTYITQVRATDPDLKPLLRYEVDFNQSEARNEDGIVVNTIPLANLFEMQAADGVLKVAGDIDRELISSVKLKLTVEDVASANGIKQMDVADMIVTILDDNDNAPVFTKNRYIASIAENSANKTSVVRVQATDLDTSPGSIVTYALRPNKGDADRLNFPLRIDSQTGVISVASRIDREARDWINFTVLATDSGPTRKNSATAEVLVKVLDENDSSPKFVDTLSNITVPEDIRVGFVVGQVEAVDPDEGEYGKVFYILDRQTSFGKFAIDSLTGVITVAEPLDREETSSYVLVVQAFDNYRYGYSVGESRSDFKQIAVKVLDSNDEVPEFDAEQLKTKVSVSEFHEGVITTVRAHDHDDPDTPNSWISFKIKGGNDLNLFKLEQGKNVAKILPARALKGFFGNYTLVIEARDSGRPSNAADAEQHIEVTDTNDSPPRILFPRQNTTLKIAENTSVGATLLIVRGVDDDIGLNGLVRYRMRKDLAGHWRTFDIHEINGVLSLKEPLDRERQKIYQIRVEAYDLGTPIPLSTDLDLTLIVTNVDDHKPQFSVSSFTINFTENAPTLSERFQLPETVDLDDDDDDAKAAQVCYFIIPDSTNSSKIFTVDPLQHFISTKVKLDREKVSNYTLKIAATEDCALSGSPSSRDISLLTVKIFVTDENDSAPRFVQKVFSGGVSTSTDFGTEFMNVVAVDDDFDDEISYSIVHPIMILLSDGLNHLSNNEALFQLNNETGTVSLGFDPQPNMKGHFLITVQATDRAGHYDRAKALVYLLRDDQKVRVVVRQNPADIRKRVNEFVQTLSNVTGVIVNVDLSFKFHQHKDGSVDKTKTCFLIHFVHPEKNLVLDVYEALRLIDLNIEELDGLFKEFNVVDTEAATLPLLPAKEHSESRNIVIVYASGSAIFLTVLLFVVVSLCFAQRAKFQRQLKAATANSYGSNSCSTNPPRITTGTIPNTNVHSTEGSNPIWMQAYHNNWYKEDSMSENSETRDSLDENAVSSSSPSSHLRSFVGSEKELKRKNDLNRTFHKNLVYNNRIDSNTCLILKKHLETTEL